MEGLDWSDLKMFDGGFSYNSAKGENSSGNEKKMDKKKEEFSNNDDLSNVEALDWNEMKNFDDDHDDDWFKMQEKKLAEQYGGNFLKVKYCSSGRVAYFCEICLAECNAKKSLELHCNGMKHLKKKDLWEKEGKPLLATIGKDEYSRSSAKELSPDPIPPPYVRPPGSKGSGGRGGFGFNPYDRNPYDGSGGGGGYDRYPPRDPYYQPFAPPLMSIAPDFHDIRPRYPERDYDPYSDRVRGRGYDGDIRDRSPRRVSPLRPRYYGDSTESKDFKSRESRDKNGRRSRSMERSNKRRSRSRERRNSPDFERRRSPYKAPKAPSPPDYERRRSPYKAPKAPSPPGSERRRSPYKAPKAPSPPSFKKSSSPTNKKVNLIASPAGSLLQKLSECCVKSSDDADLAMDVVTSLLKSLKEYSNTNNEMKIAELISEAELKVGTVRALKVGMKMLSGFTTNPSAIDFKKPEDFLNTLTANASANQSMFKTGSFQSNAETSMPYSSSSVQNYGSMPYYKM